MRRSGKKVIQIAGNPLYQAKQNKNELILDPRSGGPIFGQFPEISFQNITFEAGPIYLRYGEHIAVGRGWGFEHIWKSRFPTALTKDDATPLVTGLVGGILISGAAIHHEYGLGSQSARTSVFRSRHGVAIIERRTDGKNNVFYSVVTAFSATKVNGPKIGSI